MKLQANFELIGLPATETIMTIAKPKTQSSCHFLQLSQNNVIRMD